MIAKTLGVVVGVAYWAMGCAPVIAMADAQEVTAEQVTRAQTIAQQFHEFDLFHGAVLLAVGDTVVVREGFGLANVEHAVPNTPETKFRLASLTKQFTAAAIMLLVESGKVELNQPISKYLPALDAPFADQVTVHHLLTHSGGITPDVDNLSSKDMGDQYEMHEMVDLLGQSELLFSPGERFEYSNAGYVLAAAIIEAVGGKPYGEMLQELIFEPLGMNNTGDELDGVIVKGLASGYWLLPDGMTKALYENKSHVTGAGSIYSTVDDLFIWSRALLSDRLLSRESRLQLFDQHVGTYGYGWIWFGYMALREDGTTSGGHHKVCHTGACPGFSSVFCLYLDHDITVIVLANVVPSDKNRLSLQLGDVVLGFDVEKTQPEVGNEIFRLALQESVPKAVERYEGFSGVPSMGDINDMGYAYLETKQNAKAITIFKFLIAAYPWEANGYDSLGEAYMISGDTALAITYYEQSLMLDPSNPGAVEMLKKLHGTEQKEKPPTSDPR